MASEWSMYADPVGLDEGETFVTTSMNASFDCIPVTITPTPLAEVRARVVEAAKAVDDAHNPAGLEVDLPERRGGERLSDALDHLSEMVEALRLEEARDGD